MKTLTIIFLSLFSAVAFAGKVECKAGSYSIIVQQSSEQLLVTFLGETAIADGLLSGDEVDLIAKFKSVGEMTLFAKVGKESPDSYAFIQGKRISVICR
jgi:hypothetical protein